MVLVATQVKRRRGTTAENDAFTGAEGEIVVDTERHELRVHDGVTQGGFKIGGGSGALVVGQILEVVGTADYTPEGCLLADGAEYTKAQFPDLWANFLTGTPKLQTCTYTEYADQIAEYGFCNKFAVDTTNETFKVPTRNKYRKLVKKIVNGTSWANIYDDGWCEQGGVNSIPAQLAGMSVNLVVAMNDTNYNAVATLNTLGTSWNSEFGTHVQRTTNSTILIQHGSHANPSDVSWRVCGYSPIPDSTSNITREFVVVANGTLNQEQMDWSAWASSLAGKANIDLSNTPSNIDYVIEEQLPTADNSYTWYRKYKSGWVEMGGIQTGSASVSGSTEATLGTITLPVVMANNNYFGIATGNSYVIFMRHEFTTTTATFRFGGYSGNRTLNTCRWYISGKSAQ